MTHEIREGEASSDGIKEALMRRTAGELRTARTASSGAGGRREGKAVAAYGTVQDQGEWGKVYTE